jgi:Histidine kinase-, DNA gyrase B-, and HSP90-like ATPase
MMPKPLQIRAPTCEEEGFCDLVVEDDGIGMSEHVLTGPLIEFGKSFWTSAEAQEEFPGLVSRNLHQTGRYGIGFFSTLMVNGPGDRLAKLHGIIRHRRWDRELISTRCTTGGGKP